MKIVLFEVGTILIVVGAEYDSLKLKSFVTVFEQAETVPGISSNDPFLRS